MAQRPTPDHHNVQFLGSALDPVASLEEAGVSRARIDRLFAGAQMEMSESLVITAAMTALNTLTRIRGSFSKFQPGTKFPTTGGETPNSGE